jgi:hypothetical protein
MPRGEGSREAPLAGQSSTSSPCTPPRVPTAKVETLHTERVPPRRANAGLRDLVPVPGPEGSFCKRDEQGNLVVSVMNQGSADAGASTTAVTFAPGGTFSQPTPAIPAGGTIDIAFAIPPVCFQPKLRLPDRRRRRTSGHGVQRGQQLCRGDLSGVGQWFAGVLGPCDAQKGALTWPYGRPPIPRVLTGGGSKAINGPSADGGFARGGRT